MKGMFFAFFFATMITLIAYVFYRGLQVLSPQTQAVRIIYSAVYLFMMSAFFFRMFRGDSGDLRVAYISGVIGYTWFVALIYLALIALSVDIFRIAMKITGAKPHIIYDNLPVVKTILAAGSLLLVTALLARGNYNFNHPQITRLNISADTVRAGKTMKIVMASDLHISSYIGADEVKKYVDMINAEHPDLVLFAGDIADRSYEPFEKLKIGEELTKIVAKYGVYAIPGNHETYGGAREKIFKYLNEHGVSVLKDSVAEIDSSLYIIGRDDRSNHKRAALDNLLVKADKPLPRILLDHQPFNLIESRDKVDLQLSGHTHLGQFWPATAIVKWMYELPYGYKKSGRTNYYVSSGLGIWGPKIRLGSKSELVVIEFRY